MFDMNEVSKRYFTAKINNIKIEIEPPKIKTLKKIMAAAKKANENAMDDLAEAIKMLLNKNKTGYKIPDKVIDEMDYDQITEILDAFFSWLNKNKKDPN